MLAQSGNVVVGRGDGDDGHPFGNALHVGAACGVIPILEVGIRSVVKAVGKPERALTGVAPEIPKYAGSVPCVTSSGTCTSKIKWRLAEFGDEPNWAATCMLSALALGFVICPATEKSPMTVAESLFVQL